MREVTKDFHTQLADHLQKQGCTENYHYIDAVSALDKAVGTHNVKRDEYSGNELAKLKVAQEFLRRMMEKGMSYWEALDLYRDTIG